MVPTETNFPFDEAIDVDSVAEEYEFISRQCCRCGGEFQLKRQRLLAHKDRHYDLIETQCEACHEPRDFLFDINSFFGQNSGLTGRA